MRDCERTCNQCGAVYRARNGWGGGSASDRDRDLFPFDERTLTGVRLDGSPHWMHGAHCSDACYSEAYYEPPTPGVNW